MSVPLAGRVLAVAGLVAGATSTAIAAPSKAKPSARVTYLEGPAQILRRASRLSDDGGPRSDAPWKRLEWGTRLGADDAVRTGAGARLELTFADGSRVRLGPKSSLTVQSARFRAAERQVTMRLWLGRLWARVARRLGSGSQFEVKTGNAVAGVRGTSFAVLAHADLSSVVKVYTGTVGVKKSGAYAKRRRTLVAGPQRVDRQQWEEVIATAMHQVRVTHLGEIRPAEDFVDQGPDQAWASWNQQRDQRP